MAKFITHHGEVGKLEIGTVDNVPSSLIRNKAHLVSLGYDNNVRNEGRREEDQGEFRGSARSSLKE